MTDKSANATRLGASGLDLDVVDKLLTTTRAVRKRLDMERPVSLDVLLECIELAIQAPTGNNSESWRWLVVTDPEMLAKVAKLYSSPLMPDGSPKPTMEDTPDQHKVYDSAQYLIDNIHKIPAMIIPCTRNAGGAAGWPPSIYPATWSLMLALRSRGLGTCLTTVHLFQEQEANELLGVPEDFVQTCLLPVAYFTGDDFKPANRIPAERVTFLNSWGISPETER